MAAAAKCNPARDASRCKLRRRRQGISQLRSGSMLGQYRDNMGCAPFIGLFRAVSQKWRAEF